MIKKRICFFLLISAILVPVIHAEETVTEAQLTEALLFMEVENVVTASKKEETLEEAPGVITVLSADELKAFGGTTLYDILQRIPSIQPAGSHLYPQNFTITRGDLISHTDNHVLILINGRPFRDGIQGGYNATIYTAFPLEAIERIEIIRGPGSVLYGTNAMDGVINIITRRAQQGMKAGLSAGAGSFGEKHGAALAEYEKDDLNIVAHVSSSGDEGWDYSAATVRPSPAVPPVSGSMKYYTKDSSQALFLAHHGFSFNAYSSSIKRGHLGVNPLWQLSGGDGQSWLTMERRFVDIGYTRPLGQSCKLNLNLTHNYCEFISFDLAAAAGEASNDLLAEASIDGRISKKLSFVAGALSEHLKRSESPNQKLVDYDRFNSSLYFQVDYKPVTRVKLTTGAQYIKPPEIDAATVPRLGMTWQFAGKAGIKALYAEAFRSPYPMETSVDYPGILIGNPRLLPEKVDTFDAQLFYHTGRTQSSLTCFRSTYKDLIGRTILPTGETTFANLGTMDIQGVELESQAKLLRDVYLMGSVTCQAEKDDKVLSPNVMAKAGVSYRMPFGLTVGIFDSYYAAPKQNAGQELNPDAQAVNLMSVNLNFSVPKHESVTVNLFIQNALDEQYYFPEFSKNWVNTLPLEPGRSVYGTITYQFTL